MARPVTGQFAFSWYGRTFVPTLAVWAAACRTELVNVRSSDGSVKPSPESYKSYLHHVFHVCSKHASLYYRGQASKTRNLRFIFSDIPLTLKQCQGHQTYDGNVDPKQTNNHAKFERSCFNGVQEKANINFFFLHEEICELSPLSMCENQK